MSWLPIKFPPFIFSRRPPPLTWRNLVGSLWCRWHNTHDFEPETSKHGRRLRCRHCGLRVFFIGERDYRAQLSEVSFTEILISYQPVTRSENHP